MYYRRQNYPLYWEDLDRLEHVLNQLYTNSQSGSLTRSQEFPAMNVWVGENGAVVSAELPGVDPENIDIQVVGETLTIQGERKPFDVGENAKQHRVERGSGKFTRSIQLPFPIQAEKVDANLEKGILESNLPELKPTNRERYL